MTETTKIVFRQGVPTEPKVGEYRARSSSRGNEFDLSFDGKHWMLPCGTRHRPHSEYWYAGPLDIQFEQPLPVPKSGVAKDKDGVEYAWLDHSAEITDKIQRYFWYNRNDCESTSDRSEFLKRFPSLKPSDLHPI